LSPSIVPPLVLTPCPPLRKCGEGERNTCVGDQGLGRSFPRCESRIESDDRATRRFPSGPSAERAGHARGARGCSAAGPHPRRRPNVLTPLIPLPAGEGRLSPSIVPPLTLTPLIPSPSGRGETQSVHRPPSSPHPFDPLSLRERGDSVRPSNRVNFRVRTRRAL